MTYYMPSPRSKTCCFTGHRPEKLFPKEYYMKTCTGPRILDIPSEQRLNSMLYLHIYEAIAEGYDAFVTGMARGVDTWAANIVLELKQKYPHIKLVCAVPYEVDYEKAFKGADLWETKFILRKADSVFYLNKYYHRNCMLQRNQFMVDHSSKLIGVVRDYRSGTGQTIRYAKKQGIKCEIIDMTKIMQLFPVPDQKFYDNYLEYLKAHKDECPYPIIEDTSHNE